MTVDVMFSHVRLLSAMIVTEVGSGRTGIEVECLPQAVCAIVQYTRNAVPLVGSEVLETDAWWIVYQAISHFVRVVVTTKFNKLCVCTYALIKFSLLSSDMLCTLLQYT